MNNDHGVAGPDWITPGLGFAVETERLRRAIADWIEGTDPAMQDALNQHFLAGSRYLRPLAMFSCARAMGRKVDDASIRSAVAPGLFRNMTPVVDDVLDHSTNGAAS